jgi:RNA polymerase sigma factor (TIGR02999 family)
VDNSARSNEQGSLHAPALPPVSSLPADALLPLVYQRLRRLAGQQLAEERNGHTLQATALVHEAYLRLVGERASGDRPDTVRWTDSGHFFRAAAEVMRHVLIDHARAHASLKRGGGGAGQGQDRHRIDLDEIELTLAAQDPSEILALDEAISRLADSEPQLAAVVRLRFYAGLSVEETAAALGISSRSVKRDWSFARAWLYRELAL